ncbi:MAG: 6-phosphofructokinase [Chloroflexi bacterium]|nr:6-phosphofructokinase [Chloroflexota bacterium]
MGTNLGINLKGNLLVGQSGGVTAVINSSLAGVIHEAFQQEAIDRVYGTRHGIEGVLAQDFIDLRTYSASQISGLRGTPAAALGSCRYKLSEDEYEQIVKVLRAHNIRYFIYIGGNDSADTSHRVARLADESGYELRVVGVPKTIDNDLPITDHCPGYGSVARFVALATMDAGLDTESMRRFDPVKIIETMGRNAGWLAAASALGKLDDTQAPHLIYVPERRLEVDKFLADVEEVYRRVGYVVAVVAETLRGGEGQPVGLVEGDFYTDSFGHRRITGTGQTLCNLITKSLGVKARWDKPGTIQRVSTLCISSVDEEESYIVGRAAVKHAVAGESDKMVILIREAAEDYRCAPGLANLEEIANAEKTLPDEYINASGNFVTEGFLKYARPLIGAPLPEHFRFGGGSVSRLPLD